MNTFVKTIIGLSALTVAYLSGFVTGALSGGVAVALAMEEELEKIAAGDVSENVLETLSKGLGKINYLIQTSKTVSSGQREVYKPIFQDYLSEIYERVPEYDADTFKEHCRNLSSMDDFKTASQSIVDELGEILNKNKKSKAASALVV